MKTFKIVDGDISDGFHTFDELYEHRVALFLRLCEECSYEKYYRQDYETWFCIYLMLPEGQISYHLPNKYLERVKSSGKFGFVAPDYDTFWDGHTPAQVVNRLLKEV